ncbi:helix-hairpin-helix domain-containing protein [Micromonospora sp. NPDC048871]|uniref:ComEA family DNA-binding protein n=1 Tax=unclassified Micromonospora TaxID=2617518 RepID=UPI002E107F1C|nr:helix-hairpin-helix domain-containing protein [Micromonospora sp. NBC_01739]
MSSGHDPRGWPPSEGYAPSTGYPPAGPGGVGHPAARLMPAGEPSPAAKFSWRLLHSWWLLLPILGLSCLGGFGFLYVGLRARRPAWWLAGCCYLVVGWAAFILTGSSDSESAFSDWMVGLMLAVWIAGIVHACLINSAWLRHLAGYRPWYEQPIGGYPPGTLAPPPSLSPATPPTYPTYPSTSSSYPPATPVDPPTYPPTGPTSGWYPPTQSTAPAYSPPTAPGYPVGDPTFAAYPPPLPTDYFGPAAGSGPGQPVTPAGPTEANTGPLEVNTAGLNDLAALPGFDSQRAGQVLIERDRRGGFGSLSEFVAAAGLAPHEYARLRDRLVCARPIRPPGQPPQGRVLDV